jgi:DNA-binding MarR family transcriptional regulator
LMTDVYHEDAVLRTFILFVQSAQAVLKYADSRLYRKMHLSVVKLIVLRVLAFKGGVMTPSEIAEWTQTERHNITTLINRMRQDGLVVTERRGSDKRFVNVTLTDKGRETLVKATPVAQEVVNQVMLSITEHDAALLEKKLAILRQNAHHGLENLTTHI